MDKNVHYVITGYVYGKYWGGGEGAYNSEELRGNDLDVVIAKAKEMLSDGSLDSGMGYEALIGARLDVEEITEIEVDGEIYSHSDYWPEYIGKLSEEQKEFLEEIM